MEAGYIYILYNPSLRQNLYKIGVTTKLPQIRAQQLSSRTGVADKYEVVFKELVSDCRIVESLIHKHLDEHRWNPDREFFELPLEEAIRMVRDIIQEHQRFDRPILQNKWYHGKANFDFSGLPSAWFQYSGILPITCAVDPSVGSEVSLLMIDDCSYLAELSSQKPFNLFLTSGLAFTNFGPIFFHLLSIHEASNVGTCLHTTEIFVNPSDYQQMLTWQNLARQSHWHLFLLDRDKEQVDFFEFENVFNLQQTLYKVAEQCEGIECTDFMAAKEEFYDRYDIEDLLVLPLDKGDPQLKLF